MELAPKPLICHGVKCDLLRRRVFKKAKVRKQKENNYKHFATQRIVSILTLIIVLNIG